MENESILSSPPFSSYWFLISLFHRMHYWSIEWKLLIYRRQKTLINKIPIWMVMWKGLPLTFCDLTKLCEIDFLGCVMIRYGCMAANCKANDVDILLC